MSLVGRQRSVAAVHHQHQHSDSFIDSSTNKWLQNASLQDSSYRSSGTSQGSRFGRSFQGSDPSTPLLPPRSSSLRKKDDTSLSEFSPGLLDLQSFDTELLPEMPVPNQYDGSSLFHPARDKEKANHVAKIKVVVRKRPLNRKERAKREEDIITIESHSNSLTVNETKLKVDLTEYVEKHEFVFDAVLDEDVSNNEVYSETVESIVPLIFQRTKATCFAYGQTGSGKTYTMQPLPLKASSDILRLMHSAYRDHGFQLFVSFFEIYGGKVFDLLNDRRKLCMREDGKQQVCIVGLQEYRASNVEMIKELIERGNTTRSTGTTGANEESSRSHAILQLAIKKVIDDTESKPGRLVGKLSFIDLAGSERGADTTDNDKQTRMEGAEINKSLLALKECIRALDNDQVHIPFRGSKLTEVLRDSFVGNSRTVMISCISPSSGSCEHTINTLRYADRVKSLSKGSNLKKDPLPSSSSNAKDSTTPPLPSPFHAEPSIDTEHVPSGTAQRNRPPFLHPDYYKGQRSGPVDPAGDDWYYEKEKSSSMKSTKAESRFQDGRTAKPRDPLELIGTNSSRDLNLLLKEEEDLVNAHRRQVEESIDTVKEEMNLLVEADEAGNQLDDYLSKLSNILSRKAAGVLQLQNHLAHFQRRLSEYNVLLPSDR